MIKSVKIGGIVYDVVETSGLFDESTKLNGHIEYQKTKIELESNMSAQCKKVILFHEILHGIMTQAGLENDEKLVEILAYGLVGVLQDNPELVTL